MGEIRKVYDNNFQYLGYNKDRSLPLEENEYILVTGVLVFSLGKLLVTKRAKGKSYPGKWEFTMGSVIEGEGSLLGAIRELKEEVGIIAQVEDLQFLGQRKENKKFSEIYLLEKKVDEIILQEEEVENYKWIDKKQLDKMLENQDFAQPMEERILAYYQIIKEKIK